MISKNSNKSLTFFRKGFPNYVTKKTYLFSSFFKSKIIQRQNCIRLKSLEKSNVRLIWPESLRKKQKAVFGQESKVGEH